MLHHGVGLHFIENNAFHSLFFQKSLYAVQIPEAFDGRPADDEAKAPMPTPHSR